MQNGTEEKKIWQTPECFDLDVNKTSGKPVTLENETSPNAGTAS
jgi:hypothetical protein